MKIIHQRSKPKMKIEETSFANLPDAYGEPTGSLELQEKLKKFYKDLEDKGYI